MRFFRTAAPSARFRGALAQGRTAEEARVGVPVPQVSPTPSLRRLYPLGPSLRKARFPGAVLTGGLITSFLSTGVLLAGIAAFSPSSACLLYTSPSPRD